MRRELPVGHRALELFALWSFAVAQPVLALVASSPDFFSERKAPAAAIVVFALVILFAGPVLVLLLEAAVERARPGWVRVLHDSARFVLLWAIALQLLNWLDMGATRLAGINAPGWSLIFVAAIVAICILSLLWRSQGARMSVRFLAMAVPVALVMFLISAPLGEAPGSPTLRVGQPVPIVMIVMDELPVTSLLKSPDQIDAGRVPNFARLAREGTFYSNATTVADQTAVAVPAMLSGARGPTETVPADEANWPQNLFGLLRGRYRLHVREPITRLCPAEACPGQARSTSSAVGSLASEAPRLAFVSVAPNDLARRSPLIGEPENDPGEEVESFLRGVGGEDGPTLNFLHVLAPHRPWGRLPSGRPYRAPGQDEVPERVRETLRLPSDRKLARDLWRAHLLQVGYADRLLGRVIDHLRESGMYDRALVVVAADHGVSFRPGQPLRDVTSRNLGDIASVPLFIKRPGGRGRGIDPAPAQTIDVLPTILDVIRARQPRGLQGRSLLGPEREERVVKVRSARSTFVAAGLSELRAARTRVLEVQNRDVIGSDLWQEVCLLPASGC